MLTALGAATSQGVYNAVIVVLIAHIGNIHILIIYLDYLPPLASVQDTTLSIRSFSQIPWLRLAFLTEKNGR